MDNNYEKKEYLKSIRDLGLSILAFATYGSIIALTAFSTMVPIIKIPMLLISFSLFIYSDCRRLDKWNYYKIIKKAKDEYEEMDTLEEQEEVKTKKLGLVSKIKRMISKKKEVTLPLIDVNEEMDTLEEQEEVKTKKLGLVSKIKRMISKKKEETLPLIDVNEEMDTFEEHQVVNNLKINDAEKIVKTNKISRNSKNATIIKMPNLSENSETKVKYIVNGSDYITQNIISSYLYGQTGKVPRPKNQIIDGEKVKVYTLNK